MYITCIISILNIPLLIDLNFVGLNVSSNSLILKNFCMGFFFLLVFPAENQLEIFLFVYKLQKLYCVKVLIDANRKKKKDGEKTTHKLRIYCYYRKMSSLCIALQIMPALYTVFHVIGLKP